jgi:ATP-dependent RNA helicase DDX51/DBP6
VVAAERKPAALAALLAGVKGQPTVVFASSLGAIHRLAALLRALGPELVGGATEYSAALAPPARRAALAAFRSGAVSVLVASDAMARGMDVEGVAVVVNYDAPVYAKTYVHRAGRTARAGRRGRVITLLRREDVRHFKAMLKKADGAFVKDEALGAAVMEAVAPAVDAAVGQMAAELAREEEQRQRGEAAVGGGGGAQRAAAQAAALTSADAGAQTEARREGRGRAPKRRKLHGVPELLL